MSDKLTPEQQMEQRRLMEAMPLNNLLQITQHRYSLMHTGERGCDTGRRRVAVQCITCCKVLHPGTTSAQAYIVQHEAERSRPTVKR